MTKDRLISGIVLALGVSGLGGCATLNDAAEKARQARSVAETAESIIATAQAESRDVQNTIATLQADPRVLTARSIVQTAVPQATPYE